MRFGQLRGVTLTVALLSMLMIAHSAFADGFIKTIPPEVLAQDLNTGQPYFAPPIPWGHYAKDGPFDHFYPKPSHLSFLHHGCKNCGGSGLGNGGKGCGSCGGSGCGLGSKCGMGGKCGLFKHGCNSGADGCGSVGGNCGDPGCGSGHGSARRIKDCGLCKNKGCGLCQSSSIGNPIYVTASSQSIAPQTIMPMASGQVVNPSGFVGGQTMLCDGCVGKGCGKCGFGGLLHKGNSDPCGACGTKGCCGKCGLFNHASNGCGECGGKGCGKCGLFNHAGNGCGECGGRGCGKCGLFNRGGNGCNNCGGKGCGLCSGMKSKLAGLLHHKQGKIKYFVGPGRPCASHPGICSLHDHHSISPRLPGFSALHAE